MTLQKGADHLVTELARAGVEMAFGFPGESTLPLYAAFQHAAVRHVMARCERCAGYMADAYARITRRVAVCDAPGGIGSPHVLPALHEAYNSSIPLIMLTTATPDASTERWATSQCRHEDMFAPTVKEVLQVHSPERVGELTQRAVNIAVSGRPGPVHLDIASNILVEPVPSSSLNTVNTALASSIFPRFRPRPDLASLQQALRLLEKADRPLIVAGGGVLLSGAEAMLESFVNKFHIPVATTFNGKGSISELHPLAIGAVGSKGNIVANQLAEEADVVLWLGSKAGDKSTNFGRIPSPNASIIQVDIDSQEHGRTFQPTISLCADIAATLEDFCAIAQEAMPLARSSWHTRTTTLVTAFRENIRRQATEAETLNTITLMHELHQRYADTAVIVADASRACSWVGAFYTTAYAGRSVLAPRGSGSIGYALPATIAAALARPNHLVIGIGGDAGFAMACHELETAVRLGIRFIFLILNNNSLGLLNQVAGVSLNEPELLGRFASTDWAMVAQAFGCNGQTVTTKAELSQALDTATLAVQPTILNLVLPAKEESPDFQMFVSRSLKG